MNKIQNLENHILNKSPSTEIAQSEQTKLNKSQSLLKPSMIKKNKKFTTTATTTFSKDSDPNQPNSNRNT
jgi:Zn-dependent M32 family carboxypeptidase